MISLKQTQRSIVKLGFDGRIHKHYQGAYALERLANEFRVLRLLEQRNCPFVPRVTDCSLETMTIVLTNCGQPVQSLGEEKVAELFAQLHDYGVEHEDACLRNITYRASDGRFCLIDFEFARILNSTTLWNQWDSDFADLESLLWQADQ